MLIAALDTSTLTLSCALCELCSGEVTLVAERSERTSARPDGQTGGHASRLPGALSDLLVAAGRKLSEVEGYAIGLGPGSFTGLRIGLATWKGLAYASRRPIAGASSLAALALAAVPSAEEGALLVPLLDARKGEVYAGFYRARGGCAVSAAPEAALAPTVLALRLAELALAGERPVALGEGLLAYPEPFAAVPRLAGEPAAPSALAVARLCAPELTGAEQDPQRLYALEPHYVRASEAEVKYPHGLGAGATKAGA
jgi:tRNA threonylcarbamoyladenosine biosynthesis protein TsaB